MRAYMHSQVCRHGCMHIDRKTHAQSDAQASVHPHRQMGACSHGCEGILAHRQMDACKHRCVGICVRRRVDACTDIQGGRGTPLSCFPGCSAPNGARVEYSCTPQAHGLGWQSVLDEEAAAAKGRQQPQLLPAGGSQLASFAFTSSQQAVTRTEGSGGGCMCILAWAPKCWCVYAALMAGESGHGLPSCSPPTFVSPGAHSDLCPLIPCMSMYPSWEGYRHAPPCQPWLLTHIRTLPRSSPLVLVQQLTHTDARTHIHTSLNSDTNVD